MKDAIYAFLLWLFGNILWDFVFVVVFSSLIAYLAKKKSDWAQPALYFVLTACATTTIVYMLVGRALLLQEQPQTTTENIELNIKAWTDKFSLGTQKKPDDKFSFIYLVALPSGRAVLVGRPKQREREGYLVFQGNVELGPPYEVALKNISPSKLEQIADDVNIEMARNKINFTYISSPFKGIVLNKAVPITSSLTEDYFMNSLDDMDNSILLATEATKQAFARAGIAVTVMHRPALSK